MRRKQYRYKISNNASFPTIEFDQDESRTLDCVCKYYALNEQNVGAVISLKCYASIPDQLNDLFDTLYLRVKVNDSQRYTYKKLLENVGLKFNEAEFKSSQVYRETLRNSLYAIWVAKIGVLSTTDDPLNDLMWAHYTNNEGFLIQWDYRLFPKNFGNPLPVSYLSEDDFKNLKSKDLITDIFENSLIKKRIWSYENEFRFIIFPKSQNSFLTSGRFSNEDHQYPREQRLQSYSKDCVNKILLGFNFFKNLLIDNGRLDFSKPTGILKKSLLDWISQNDIEVELVSIDLNMMKLVPIKFILSPLSILEYEIKYAR